MYSDAIPQSGSTREPPVKQRFAISPHPKTGKNWGPKASGRNFASGFPVEIRLSHGTSRLPAESKRKIDPNFSGNSLVPQKQKGKNAIRRARFPYERASTQRRRWNQFRPLHSIRPQIFIRSDCNFGKHYGVSRANNHSTALIRVTASRPEFPAINPSHRHEKTSNRCPLRSAHTHTHTHARCNSIHSKRQNWWMRR